MINHFPEAFKNEILAVGIDEAGRGPVLGPMVYSAAFCPLEQAESLKDSLKVADSKQLTEHVREEIFKACPQFIGWTTAVLSPSYISSKMLQPCKYNLNAISHETAASLVSEILSRGYRIGHLAVDTVGDPKKYQLWLSRKFPSIGQVVVESKADSKYPIVSAASIVAKVTRDKELNEWKFPEDEASLNGKVFDRNFGSGYPSDPTTKNWLESNLEKVFGFPTLIRFSWATCDRLLESNALSVRWISQSGDDEDERKKRKIALNDSSLTFMQRKGLKF